MRKQAVHAALRHLVNAAHGPLDRRLRQMAEGAQSHTAPEENDEELHSAIENELHSDGRPPSMEHVAHSDMQEEEVDPAETNTPEGMEPPHASPPMPHPEPSPADFPKPKKKRSGIRF